MFLKELSLELNLKEERLWMREFHAWQMQPGGPNKHGAHGKHYRTVLKEGKALLNIRGSQTGGEGLSPGELSDAGQEV